MLSLRSAFRAEQVDIIGAVYTMATVAVNNNATYRKGEYYDCALALNNESGPSWRAVTNTASLSGSTNTINGNLLAPPTNQVFSYDGDGNLTNDSVWAYRWDAENRLIQMSNLTTVATAGRKKLDFAYDSVGRRTQKVVSTNSGSAWVVVSTNRFIYDNWNLLSVIDPAFSVSQSFTWGQDLNGKMNGAGGIGGLALATVYGAVNTNCFASYDGNGNVSALINGITGATESRYDYDPFGQTVRATGSVARQNPFRFSTKFTDEETSLIWYGSRYYAPCFGRWVGRDSAEEEGGINVYSFLRNRTPDAFDTDGRKAKILAAMLALYTAVNSWISGQFGGDIERATEEMEQVGEMSKDLGEDGPRAPGRPNGKPKIGPRPPKTVNNTGRWTEQKIRGRSGGYRGGGGAGLFVAGMFLGGAVGMANAAPELAQTFGDYARHLREGESAWADLDVATFAAQLSGGGWRWRGLLLYNGGHIPSNDRG